LRRRKSLCHAIPGWMRVRGCVESSVKSRFLDNQQPTPYAANSFLGYRHVSGNSFIYDGSRRRKGGSRLKLPLSGRPTSAV
jgi:hypothetical protein